MLVHELPFPLLVKHGLVIPEIPERTSLRCLSSLPPKSSFPSEALEHTGPFAEAAAHEGSMTQCNIFLIWQCGLVVCTGAVHVGSLAFYFWG